MKVKPSKVKAMFGILNRENHDSLAYKAWRIVTLRSGIKFYVKNEANVYECEVLDEERIFKTRDYKGMPWATHTTYIKCLVGGQKKFLRFDIDNRNYVVNIKLSITDKLDSLYRTSSCTAYRTIEDLRTQIPMPIPYENKSVVLCDNADYRDGHLHYYEIYRGNVYSRTLYVGTFIFTEPTDTIRLYPTGCNGNPLDETGWYIDRDEAMNDMLATLHIITNTPVEEEVSEEDKKKKALIEWCEKQQVSLDELRKLIG